MSKYQDNESLLRLKHLLDAAKSLQLLSPALSRSFMVEAVRLARGCKYHVPDRILKTFCNKCGHLYNGKNESVRLRRVEKGGSDPFKFETSVRCHHCNSKALLKYNVPSAPPDQMAVKDNRQRHANPLNSISPTHIAATATCSSDTPEGAQDSESKRAACIKGDAKSALIRRIKTQAQLKKKSLAKKKQPTPFQLDDFLSKV